MQLDAIIPDERWCRSKLKSLISNGELLHATLSCRRQVCGRPGCKCRQGEKHLTKRACASGLDRYRTVQELLETISAAQWERLKKMKTAG